MMFTMGLKMCYLVAAKHAGSVTLRSAASCLDPLFAVHVRAQGVWDGDCAVLVLIHLDDGNQNSRACGDGVVQGVADNGLAGLGIAVAQVQAAALVIVKS